MTTAILNPAVRYAAIPTAAIPTAAVRLRLTRRGRFVLTSLASAPLVIAALAFAINGGGATASLEGSSEPLSYVTVASGQSLWQLAEQLAPQADPREVIAEIVSLNQLGSAELQAGQQLAVPSEYLP